TLSRLGIGVGTYGGRLQRDLGHDGFNALIHYAYERGITYIDTADAYRTHPYVREAIKDLPREKLFILTKMGGIPEDPLKEIDRFRSELGTDYIDCLLIHCKVTADWPETHKSLIDAFSEAKARGIIRSHGVSCHSLPALQRAAQIDWVEVNLVRLNPQAVNIDTPNEKVFDDSRPEHLPPVIEQIKLMRQNGHGVIGMKIMGEGAFKTAEERKKSITFAVQSGLVDAMTIGFKSAEEIDEAIANIQAALAEQKR
ncbi:MAG: aldo/keto reductase, partial [candidate division KSB1 bacterium]|nr:aldo/keto reductase [candidate division KSB1 bacterium]